MKGVIAAGGLGTRLGSLTTVCNKHLLPVFDQPMIFYPIQTLIKAGITEIAIVVSGKNPGNFIEVLKNGRQFGLKSIEYIYQDAGDRGISDCVGLAENFVGTDNFCLILGDNTTDADITAEVQEFKNGAHVFLKEVANPEDFGVAKFQDNQIIEIIEKPVLPPSNYAITGVYLYDAQAFQLVKELTPSPRGQLEITDLNQKYLQANQLKWSYLNGFWKDCGNPDSLFLANEYWFSKKNLKKCYE